MFATFDSVVAAVQAAVALQRRIAAEPFEGQALQIRIGVHLGDVLLRDGRAFGDAINIAARLEALARPGTICISEGVYRQVRNTLDEQFVDLGRQKLKNISDPVHAYLIVPSGALGPVPRRSARHWVVAAGALALLAAAGVLAWRHQQSAAPGAPKASGQAEERKSVAVLPFVNMSGNDADEYLSDGMTEEIITALSKLSGLRVAARTSSFAFKGKNEAIEKIGDQLHVHAVLEGSVRKAANRLRITTQLINIADGYHLWSESYDREMADIFAIQSEVAQRVADALKVTLLADERQRLERKATENLDAYNSYLLGRYYWNKRTEEGFQKGIEQFEQAIDKDPNYAAAYAGLADCYLLASDADTGGLPPATAMPKARAAVTRALEIDDTLAEAHNSLAMVFQRDWDWLAAEGEWKRALQLNPNYATAHHWYGMFWSNRGRADEAIAEVKRAQELDPLSLIISTARAVVLYHARRYDEAVDQAHRTLAMDPKFARTHWVLGVVYLQQGMNEEAIAELQAARQLEDGQRVLAQLGYTYAVSGRTSDAQKALNDLNELSQRHYVDPFSIAVIYTGLGDKDRAFEWLGRAYEERSSGLMLLKVEPLFDSVRSDPRFTALLKKVGLDQ
ncbi:MAG: tetratricopeptide repeat protein [Deltaproteobacteria bacterium]|nr:tetratricopeptide repeat protein [Deltaproteobacteria bacterium]MBI3389440.1 tetratricopeptide repeat protein [Deltaproteobacteria bacterium]